MGTKNSGKAHNEVKRHGKLAHILCLDGIIRINVEAEGKTRAFKTTISVSDSSRYQRSIVWGFRKYNTDQIKYENNVRGQTLSLIHI